MHTFHVDMLKEKVTELQLLVRCKICTGICISQLQDDPAVNILLKTPLRCFFCKNALSTLSPWFVFLAHRAFCGSVPFVPHHLFLPYYVMIAFLVILTPFI